MVKFNCRTSCLDIALARTTLINQGKAKVAIATKSIQHKAAAKCSLYGMIYLIKRLYRDIFYPYS